MSTYLWPCSIEQSDQGRNISRTKWNSALADLINFLILKYIFTMTAPILQSCLRLFQVYGSVMLYKAHLFQHVFCTSFLILKSMSSTLAVSNFLDKLSLFLCMFPVLHLQHYQMSRTIVKCFDIGSLLNASLKNKAILCMHFSLRHWSHYINFY